MQVPPATPYGGADPEWSVSLDELSGCNVPEDASLSNGASIAFLFQFEKIRIAFLGDAHPSVCVDGLLKLGYSSQKPAVLIWSSCRTMAASITVQMSCYEFTDTKLFTEHGWKKRKAAQ